MGMFDSFYDERNDEWQTKAFGCVLGVYRVGDEISAETSSAFQVEILGPCASREVRDFSLATIRDGRLAEIDADRDSSIPLLNYSGRVIDHGARKAV